MVYASRKTLTGLVGLLSGALVAAVLMLSLNLDNWWYWLQDWGSQRSVDHSVPESVKAQTHRQSLAQRQGELRAWRRLPTPGQADLVMLGLTQAMQSLGLQVQSMQMVPTAGQASQETNADAGPQVLLSIRLLGTYAQWLQWWETSRQEGVAWWPLQMSMVPATAGAGLQIEGHWRVWLSDQPQAEGVWTHDVNQWAPSEVSDTFDPFDVQRLAGPVPAAAVPARQRCPQNTLMASLQELQLVGLLQGGDQHPGQAVLQAGLCQWVVRPGQRVGLHGHALHSLGPGTSIWLARVGHADGVRLSLRKKEKP